MDLTINEIMRSGRFENSINLRDGTVIKKYIGESEDRGSKKKLLKQLPLNIWSRNLLDMSVFKESNNYLGQLQVYVDDSYIYTISDYEEYILEKIFVKNKETFQPYEIGEYLYQIVKTIDELHELNIFHSYLNTSNIFLQNRTIIKIGGFELSETLSSKDAISDESIRLKRPLHYNCSDDEKQNLGLKYDIWCIGLIFYELLFKESAQTLLENNLQTNWNENLPPLPDLFNQSFTRKIYKSLLEFDYKKRKWLNVILNEESIALYVLIFSL
jgi:serine/threonine protein kinase